MPTPCAALTAPKGRVVAAEPIAAILDDVLAELEGAGLEERSFFFRLRILLDHLKGVPLPL